MESNYQKALNELCDYALGYFVDSDCNESSCGGVFSTNKAFLEDMRRPLQELVSKEKSEKPFLKADKFDFSLCCYNCEQPIINVWSKKDYKPRYCHCCGQKLDWSE